MNVMRRFLTYLIEGPSTKAEYCSVCKSPVSTHPDAGQLALAYCGNCNKPTCGDCRDDSKAQLCVKCQHAKLDEEADTLLVEMSVQELSHSLSTICPPLTNPQGAGLLLPDGKLLGLGMYQHEEICRRAGASLADAMKLGIVHYDGRSGIVAAVPITDAQAETVHDYFRGDPVLVDIMDAASGRVKTFKKFERHTADAIRNYVSQALSRPFIESTMPCGCNYCAATAVRLNRGG